MIHLLAQEKKNVKFTSKSRSGDRKFVPVKRKVKIEKPNMTPEVNQTPDPSSKSRADSAKKSRRSEDALKKAKDEIKEIRKTREEVARKAKEDKKPKQL